MFEYRLTKYDPALRDSTGRYTRAEWTYFKQIGQVFDGVVFALEEYQRVEDGYVMSAISFLRESGQFDLDVNGLQDSNGSSGLRDGQRIGIDDIGTVIRKLLREEFWCRLEGQECFLHFGWDFYLYVGVPHECCSSIQFSQKLGLFVEPGRSPHKEESVP